MNATALPETERVRLMRALGIQPLALRRPTAGDARPAAGPRATGGDDAQPDALRAIPPLPVAAAVTATPPQNGTLPLIVLLPSGAAADARQQALLRAALLCLPQTLQRAPCIELDAHGDELPAAAAYLVLGEDTRAALGRRLALDVQATAQIEHADAPAALLAHPARKRALWLALKALRRRHAGRP